MRIWNPSTSASVQIMTLLQRSWSILNATISFIDFDLTSTPQPRTFMRSVMISFANILLYSALRQLSIFPRTGIIAWKDESRACLQAPRAESPSTMNSSRSETSLLRQSTNFCTRLPISLLDWSLPFILSFVVSARTRARILTST